MATMHALVLLASALMASAQRPFFAGSRPIGFPELVNRTTTPSGLEDKFGEGTTQRLPIEALGDRDLIDRLSKLPIDKQPFWFINWQALEAQREKPETYPQKPNQFLELDGHNNNPGAVYPNSGILNSNPGISNSNPGISNSNPVISNSNPAIVNSNPVIPGIKSPVQDPVNTDKDVTNVDNRHGTDANTGVTNTGIESNTSKQVTNSDDKKPTLTDPETNAPSASNKNIKEYIVPEENEFEDIQVKKLVKQE